MEILKTARGHNILKFKTMHGDKIAAVKVGVQGIAGALHVTLIKKGDKEEEIVKNIEDKLPALKKKKTAPKAEKKTNKNNHRDSGEK